ncbi:MAG: T9SS type A sorting domain-containing protein [Saprospiraceae bacterium]
MKKYITSILFALSFCPAFLMGQNIVFLYEVEIINSSESNVKVFAQENNGGTENLSSFSVYFYYDNTESTLLSFDYSPLTAIGWDVNQSQILHNPATNSNVPITHTGFGFTNVSDDNEAGSSIGSSPVHIVTLNFNHSNGTGAASDGFLAHTDIQPGLVYTDNFFNEYAVVVTGQQSQSLPVEWLFFRASKSGEDSRLEWATATEFNSDYFEIQHSVDGRVFTKIGQVKAAGFSTAERRYDFLHETPVTGVNYYRLKQYDLDGSYEYSNVASVAFSDPGDWQSLVQVYPNPASEFIKLEMPERDDFIVELMDMLGHTVFTEKEARTLDVGALAPGSYYLKISNLSENKSFITLVSVVR